MGLRDVIKGLFRKKEAPAAEPAPASAKAVPSGEQGKKPVARQQKKCMGCGKMFSYDPAWQFIPNYCKDCKQKFAKEKEEKQRAGEPRKIRRKCKQCGKYFTFPNTLEHYPNYCGACRKQHQAAMKAKYSRKKA